MKERGSDVALLALVLASVALVLLAPVLGRAGLPRAADLCMGLAALGGLASFGRVGASTLRAARGRSAGHDRRDPT